MACLKLNLYSATWHTFTNGMYITHSNTGVKFTKEFGPFYSYWIQMEQKTLSGTEPHGTKFLWHLANFSFTLLRPNDRLPRKYMPLCAKEDHNNKTCLHFATWLQNLLRFPHKFTVTSPLLLLIPATVGLGDWPFGKIHGSSRGPVHLNILPSDLAEPVRTQLL